ncbi:MAG: HlyD family secretion protein [Gammaproteobacteria bacterium]|nr:HlyD family secretion protein [Gammaproteobacteria bacterium]MDH5172777.1 HlyD family secretion protein [Gammaproteobacteria bacterium]
MPRPIRHFVLMLSAPVLMTAGTLAYFLANAHYVSTDNAYVQQDKVSVSTEVGGRIVEVSVRENQHVETGDILFRIDPRTYQLAVDQAKAAIATAQARVDELETVYATSNVDIESALEDIDYYEREYRRQQELLKTRVSTEAALQAAEHALSNARSDLATARATAARTKAALSTGGSDSDVNPAVQAARVQLEQARLNLSRTVVRAPVSGIVSQSDRLQVGQLMVQGLAAVSIVRDDASWVEANFKETDLRNMRVGQPAIIEVDTYPDLALKGRVESIGAGTGSEFSILPAQNANANWVKVTQRVPVRIAIDDKPARPLIAGLSVYVRIDTR